MLMLDAAFPSHGAQLVADCRAVGAGAVGPYVYGGYTNYTTADYNALRAAGIALLPIVVPGNVPPNAGYLAQTLSSLGFSGGPLAIDIEYLSYPPKSWVASLPGALPGMRLGTYGGGGDLVGSNHYPRIGWEWLSYWPYAPGVWQPVPSLSGFEGWQYAHDVNINGHTYDISVIDPVAIFGLAPPAPTPPPPPVPIRRRRSWL